jgi:hypothetical protein
VRGQRVARMFYSWRRSRALGFLDVKLHGNIPIINYGFIVLVKLMSQSPINQFGEICKTPIKKDTKHTN